MEAGREQRFGKYVLIEELGRGSMGVVYKAVDPDLSRQVAIKFLGISDSPDAIERFLREARATAGLKHPNLCRIYEAGEKDGRYYIVMQYVEGGDLGGQRLAPRRAAEIVRDAARAVQCAHDAGVVHRDLKPENVLVDAEGVPYVTDFGLAKLLKAETAITQAGFALGSPAYMAPEQAGGIQSKIGPRTDVYALGATLYGLVTGRPPFDAGTAMETMLAVRDGAVVPPSRYVPDLAPALERICLKAMSRRVEERHATAAALAQDLDRFLGARATGTGSTTRRRRAVVPKKRSWRYRAVVGAMYVLPTIGTLGGFLAYERLRERPIQVADPAGGPEVERALAWIRLSSGSVVRLEWSERPGPGEVASVRWRGQDHPLTGEDVDEVLPGPPGPPPVRRTPAAFRRLGPGDFEAAAARVTFDQDPAGRAIAPGADVELAYRSLGVVLDAEFEETFVHADPYTVDSRSRGLSAAIRDPRWHGHVHLSFWVPGSVDPATRQGLPGVVHRVGVFVAHVVPGGTGLRAYGPDGSILHEVMTEREGTDFLGLESPRPIHRVEVFDVPEIDPNLTTDDWVFDPIRGPEGDADRFTVLLTGGERLRVDSIRGDGRALALAIVEGGPETPVPLDEVLEVLPPAGRLRGRGPWREIGPAESTRIARWDDSGVSLEDGGDVAWGGILRVRKR